MMEDHVSDVRADLEAVERKEEATLTDGTKILLAQTRATLLLVEELKEIHDFLERKWEWDIQARQS